MPTTTLQTPTQPVPPPRATSHQVSWGTRRANSPTYQVVGPLARYDERDNVCVRAWLQPGSEGYHSYYSAHPELEAGDRRLRLFHTLQAQERQRASIYRRFPLALALSYASPAAPYLSPLVDGPVRETCVEAEPAIATANIKGVARYLGADLVGICELDTAWIYSHSGQGSRWGKPIQLNHRYAVSIAVAHDFDMVLASRGLSLAGTIEGGQLAFSQLNLIAVRLASYIRTLGYPARAHIPGGLVLDVPIAVDAGLGEVSRPGLLLTKKYGPAVRLATVTTDMPLAPDRPLDLGIQSFCSRCKKCATVCPVGAIPTRGKETIRGIRLWPFDAERCYRLITALGNTQCMYCVSACPWTKPRSLIHKTAKELAIRLPASRPLLIWLDNLLYGHKPQCQAFPAWLLPD